MARIALVGCGAIGSSTAGAIRLAGADLVVVDPWYQHIETIKAKGLQVATLKGLLTVQVDALHLDEFDRSHEVFDLVFLGVKAYDTGWITRVIEPHLSPNGSVVSLQNGLNEERVAEIVGSQRTVGCVVLMSADLMGPDQARRTTDPEAASFIIGELDGTHNPRIDDLQKILSPAGKTDVSSNIWGELWAKLAINCMINALSGITGHSVPQLWADAPAFDIMIHLGGEVVDVSRAVGLEMAPILLAGNAVGPERIAAAHHGDQVARTEVAKAVSGMVASPPNPNMAAASLAQDLVRHRRTEVEYLNGLVGRIAQEHGLSAPYNSVLPGLVRRIESGELPPDPANIQQLAHAAGGAPTERAR
jgi:2-dehydropantoate 2-reductase